MIPVFVLRFSRSSLIPSTLVAVSSIFCSLNGHKAVANQVVRLMGTYYSVDIDILCLGFATDLDATALCVQLSLADTVGAR